MTFDEWIQEGMRNGWCGVPVCETHDGLPMTKQEEDSVWDGDDPCVHILRLYESAEQKAAVDDNFFPYKYRDHWTPRDGS